MCGENDMPATIEMGKHAYAHACEDSNCNVATPDYDGSVCPDDADDGTVTPSGTGGDALILNSGGKLGAAEDSAAAEAGGPPPEDDAYEPPSLGASVTAL